MRLSIPLGLLALMIAGCSSVQTQQTTTPLSSIQASDRIQLKVRTGDPLIDELVYEMAYLQFAGGIPIRHEEPFTGSMEITFAGSPQKLFGGTSSTVGNATDSGTGWYAGRGYVGGTAMLTGQGTPGSHGWENAWQNSTMLIVLKRNDGERLWTAHYRYHGKWKLNPFVIDTPEETAWVVIKRLKAKFQRDFGSK
jgi:hypothetical protein